MRRTNPVGHVGDRDGESGEWEGRNGSGKRNELLTFWLVAPALPYRRGRRAQDPLVASRSCSCFPGFAWSLLHNAVALDGRQ